MLPPAVRPHLASHHRTGKHSHARPNWPRAQDVRNAVSVSQHRSGLKERWSTHIGRSVLIVLTRLHAIGLTVTKQQRAAVPRSRKARNDSVNLCVASGSERSSRITKDIAGRWSAEADAVGERQSIVADFTRDVAEGGLGVDRELLGGVLGED